MKKLFMISVVAICMIGLAINAGAATKKKAVVHKSAHEGCGCSGGEGPNGHMEMLKHLGLDDKQMSTVKAIHSKTQKEMIKRKAEIRISQIELKEILSKDTVDMTAAESAVKKLEGMKSDMKMLHIKAMEEIKTVLTAEQKKKFLDMISDGPMGMGGHAPRPMQDKGAGKMDNDKMEGMHHHDHH